MTRLHRLARASAIALGFGLAAALPVPALAQEAGTVRQAEAPAERRMNVLLILADDLAPQLGVYGAPVRTPNIDRLAAGGVTFERAYSQFPLCGPSRTSFLTGTRPDTNGVTDLRTHFRSNLPDIRTLPEYFRGHGYFVGRAGKMFHQSVPAGIGEAGPDDPQSWDSVVDPRGRDRDAEKGGLVNFTPGIHYGNAMAFLADEGADAEQTDSKVADAAIEMLKANKDKPFFIGIGFYRPHVPEVAPRKYFDLYPLEKIEVRRETPEALAGILPATRQWLPDNLGMTAEEQRQMIRSYFAATSFMDAQVGRVLAAVEALGLADDTIVVFSSDHGFLLGEHGQWMKNVLWEDSARVPLIIRVPGSKVRGKRSPRTVELLDLYPTLAQLAGLPHYDRNEGRSLAPLLDRPNDRGWTKPALSQIRGGRSVRTERWRYTEWEAGRAGRELYDHRADPGEHRNLADDPRHAAVVRELRELLPAGPVEPRPKPFTYHRERGCLDWPGAPVPAGETSAPGLDGLKLCQPAKP